MRTLAGLLFFSSIAAAQTPPPLPEFRSGATEILVDAVVRDKKGRPVRGLKASDITLLEDGKPQTILDFREVVNTGKLPETREVQLQTAQQRQEGGGTALQVNRQIRLVSLVFERLTGVSRRLAREAALAFLKQDLGVNVYYAIFYMDRTFTPVLGYTNDMTKLRAAVEKVTTWDRPTVGNDRTLFRGAGSGIAAGIPSLAEDRGIVLPGQPFPDPASIEAINERFDREMIGRVSIFGLWGIITELGKLPGRKQVMLFSEGLSMSQDLKQQYLSMVSAANRNNVAVYTVDARGLNVRSDQSTADTYLGMGTSNIRQTGVEIVDTRGNPQRAIRQDAINEAARTNASPFEGIATGYGSAELYTDYALNSGYANAQVNLSDLAERTGGLAIYNTNDFAPAMRRISEEFNTYYEVLYKPGNTDYDGSFRTISLKVNQPGVTVQARSGYFALPAVAGMIVYPFEAPMLKALAATPPPKDLDFRAGALRYLQRDGKANLSLVFDVPLDKIRFSDTEKAEAKRLHVGVVALIRDAEGKVVEKLSRDVAMEPPTEKLDRFREGRLIVTRSFYLPPGRYTVESAAADFEANRIGSKKVSLVIIDRPGLPSMSDLAIVRRVEKTPSQSEPVDPLLVKDGKVVPTLMERVKAGPGASLPLFFRMYADTSLPEPARLTMDLLDNSKPMMKAEYELPKPDKEGSIAWFATLPLDQINAGEYEIRATVIQGGKTASRSVFVTID